MEVGWDLIFVFVCMFFSDGAGNTAECSFTVTVGKGECHIYYRGVSKVWERVRVGWGGVLWFGVCDIFVLSLCWEYSWV